MISNCAFITWRIYDMSSIILWERSNFSPHPTINISIFFRVQLRFFPNHFTFLSPKNYMLPLLGVNLKNIKKMSKTFIYENKNIVYYYINSYLFILKCLVHTHSKYNDIIINNPNFDWSLNIDKCFYNTLHQPVWRGSKSVQLAVFNLNKYIIPVLLLLSTLLPIGNL